MLQLPSTLLHSLHSPMPPKYREGGAGEVIYTYTYVCVYIYIYIYIHIHTCVYIYIYIYIYTYVCVYVCVYVYVYVYVCVYIYIYIYICSSIFVSGRIPRGVGIGPAFRGERWLARSCPSPASGFSTEHVLERRCRGLVLYYVYIYIYIYIYI